MTAPAGHVTVTVVKALVAMPHAVVSSEGVREGDFEREGDVEGDREGEADAAPDGGTDVVGLTVEEAVGESDGVRVSETDGAPDGDTDGDGEALTGCALPPSQALAGEHGAQVPSLPAQKTLPKAVDAQPTSHVHGAAAVSAPAHLKPAGHSPQPPFEPSQEETPVPADK